MQNPSLDSITCPVCGSSQENLSVRCTSCGAFIQERQAVLNFFEALFGVIESPRATFHRIAISEQKNYVFLLFSILGPMLAAFVLGELHVGNYPVNFGLVILAMVFFGPILGLVVFPAFAVLVWALGRYVMGMRQGYRRIQALVAYSLAPAAIYSSVILPIALAVFGAYLFSTNPTPMAYKPAVFWVLAALLGIALVWSFVNITTALAVVRLPRWKSALLAIVAGGGMMVALRTVVASIADAATVFIKTL